MKKNKTNKKEIHKTKKNPQQLTLAHLFISAVCSIKSFDVYI